MNILEIPDVAWLFIFLIFTARLACDLLILHMYHFIAHLRQQELIELMDILNYIVVYFKFY